MCVLFDVVVGLVFLCVVVACCLLFVVCCLLLGDCDVFRWRSLFVVVACVFLLWGVD